MVAGDITRVISHPQALAQCDAWLRKELPRAKRDPVYDTAGAAKMIRDDNLTTVAAICSELAASHYGMNILEKHIQDVEFNTTRFLLLSKTPCEIPRNPQYDVKTSLCFWVPQCHTHGALHKVVAAFSLREVNMTKLESRPIPGKYLKAMLAAEDNMKLANFEYCFYLDIEGSSSDQAVERALNHLREISPFVRVFSSYPTGGALSLDTKQSLAAWSDTSPGGATPLLTKNSILISIPKKTNSPSSISSKSFFSLQNLSFSSILC